jgi:hypothetical protein
MDEDNGIAGSGNQIDFTAGGELTEVEYCAQIRGVDVNHNDTIQLRVIRSGASLDAWTQTPTVTVNKPTHTPRQGLWRFYSDATPDTSMSALAAENAAPTLTQAQLENGIIRLRVQIVEIGGASATNQTIQVQYGDGVAWQDITNQSPTSGREGWWVRWANGAATGGDTISTQLLTGTTTSGKYHESTTPTEDVGSSATHEIDIAIRVHWVPPDETVRLRLVYNGTTLALNGGASEVQFITPSAANRSQTITRLAPDTSQKTSREMRFAPWYRFFYDGTRWWFFSVLTSSNTILRSWSWDGMGNPWVARTTFDFGSGHDISTSRHMLAFKSISGTPTVFALSRDS